MAANNPPSLINPLDPNSAVAAYEIQRRQALAQALQKQAMEPTEEGSMVSGWYVPTSPLNNLNKIAQQMLSMYMGQKTAEDAGTLQANNLATTKAAVDPNGQFPAMPQAAAVSTALRMGAGSGTPAPAAPSMTGDTLQPGQIGAATNRVGPTPMSAALMNKMTTPQQGVTGSPLNPLGVNRDLAAYMLINDPKGYFAAQAGAYKPTDATLMAKQAGVDPMQANQAMLNKQTYIAPVNARPGSILRNPMTMQPMAYNPHIPDGGTPTFDASGNVTSVQPLPGATNVTAGMEAAKTAGQGSALPYNGFDANGNPLPTMSRTAAVTQAPPNAGFPAGTQVPGSGQDTSDMMRILQEDRQQIAAQPDSPRKAGDLAAIDREIARTSQRPGIYGAQPPGLVTAANAAQGAPSKQMADAYGTLSSGDAGYQQSREAITEMLKLAQNKGGTGMAVGVLPEGIATRISPDAAKYQKLHATYVALQGKALGSSGSDASRATINESVPTYDKPQSAMVSGLQTQLNNLDLSHLKAQFLTPTYQAGNEKAYTQKSAAFDQNITPNMAPLLQLSGEAQRAAVLAAIKADPSLRPKFEWAYNNGMLK